MNPPAWITEDGPDTDVVVSTRCRLARNLRGIPFPWRASELQRKTAAESILHAAERAGGILENADSIPAARLNQEHLDRLVEWRIASRKWTESGFYRWVIVARDGCSSIMVNEEDHARIQVVQPGLLVESCWELAREIEHGIGRHARFAHDDRIGYLTSALTNAGTGMRLSLLLHLPGLARTGRLQQSLGALKELGAAVRGLYGEGTSGTGGLFQVSNRRAFGLHGQDIVSGAAASAAILIRAEREARLSLYGTASGRARLKREIRDIMMDLRSRDPSPRELLEAASCLRLGVSEGLLQNKLSITAEWVAIAGVSAAAEKGGSRETEEFESARRSAALRQRLRGLLESTGTFTG